ncbi:unnamed protein product [Eruca vesicaria subsp. sativa]|uniref:Uncharacterized protein n=1 Tax=Eruca vesicaria subsp. sativa TaxID=29727 RepID=A0ABC8KRH3_ERUVS|nr:unnamed protein product [Eruca vesicaria subsp. sativa]
MESSAARINAVTHGGDTALEVTAMEFDDSEGLQVAVGSSAGKIRFNDSFWKPIGLMLLALDTTLIPSYFIPELGPPPKWCSPLENLTEEMGET